MKKIIIILLCIVASVSCRKLEYTVFDRPYVYVVASGDPLKQEMSTVSYRGSRELTYMFYMSTRALEHPVTIHYTIKVGSGLENGVDFVLDKLEDDLVFNPSEYEKPLVIPFKSHTLSSSTDNTLTITIESVTPEMEIGIPGPVDPETGSVRNKNISHTILKKK